MGSPLRADGTALPSSSLRGRASYRSRSDVAQRRSRGRSALGQNRRHAGRDRPHAQGRRLDGRLADGDGRHRRCRPRSDANAARLPDHGDALAARPRPALAAGSRERWRVRDADAPPRRARRPQHDPLRRPVRLVPRLDHDPDRAGRRDRVHEPGLDRAARGRVPRRAPRRGADRRRRARPGRRHGHRPARAGARRSGAAGRARRGRRLRGLDHPRQVADDDRERRQDHLLDARRPVGDRPGSGARRLAHADARRSGRGSSSSRCAARTRTSAWPRR